MDRWMNGLLVLKDDKEAMDLLRQMNDQTSRYGLHLKEEEMKDLLLVRDQSLRRHQRIEMGPGILDQLLYTFCDSDYIVPDAYAQTIGQLLDIFYGFKNESMDRLSDSELLNFMREQFDQVCFGDLEYLRETCLPRFTRAIREGYSGHRRSQGMGEYEAFSEEDRWDVDLFYQALDHLMD